MAYEKYIATVNLMFKCVALHDLRDPANKEVDVELHVAWDELFNFIHGNFQAPETNFDSGEAFEHEVKLCQDMLKINRKDNELLSKIKELPPVLAEVIFPVATIRYLLREAALPLYPNKSNEFKEFYRRYARLILVANSRLTES